MGTVSRSSKGRRRRRGSHVRSESSVGVKIRETCILEYVVGGVHRNKGTSVNGSTPDVKGRTERRSRPVDCPGVGTLFTSDFTEDGRGD